MTSSANFHTFVVHVQDLPGVLNRVASLFRRRCFNIASLTVGRTHEAGISRMTIVVEADDDKAQRIEANLYKLVNVLHVEDITHTPSVTRDLVMLKVQATPDERSKVLDICHIFRAQIIDVAPTSVIVEMTGSANKIEGLVDALKPFGLIEMGRAGAVAMTRGMVQEASPSTLATRNNHG